MESYFAFGNPRGSAIAGSCIAGNSGGSANAMPLTPMAFPFKLPYRFRSSNGSVTLACLGAGWNVAEERVVGMVDALIIGAGPNGLTAAATLARHGWQVRVLEAQPRPGGAVYSVASTLPGFLHDVGAAFFPFADDSPAFRYLDLPGAGLQWRNARRESCHPAPDGSCVSIARDIDLAADSFGIDGPVCAAWPSGNAAWATAWRLPCWLHCWKSVRPGDWELAT